MRLGRVRGQAVNKYRLISSSSFFAHAVLDGGFLAEVIRDKLLKSNTSSSAVVSIACGKALPDFVVAGSSRLRLLRAQSSKPGLRCTKFSIFLSSSDLSSLDYCKLLLSSSDLPSLDYRFEVRARSECDM
ncbi:hypothetical protein R1flu_027229 [Riccia fluitans]|uniref:Uncharacterized protein n=1 Tax=Riccia fluitans TaxID=41844 RepID=A0ABD1XL54_9MARC